MWQPSVLETYGNQTTDYVNKTSGPMRKKYPNSTDDRELITSLTQVKTNQTRLDTVDNFRVNPNTTPMREILPS